MENRPYVEVNRAMSEPFMLGIFPIGLVGPIVLCLFLSYLITQALWSMFFQPPSYFWTVGAFFWLSATYYVVVGDEPWRIKNQISWMPTYRRGLYAVKPLLNHHD
jgi:hypothetical protein